ncbi:hypothetical protein LSH36_808g00028 [Paralvinella palmiformis]|uniref:Fucosyltransferase n=1 Tax=Paralvinella palmiformis TaxID=53620 RepID=A0AAD9IZZ3_9ANNE|nr:hypothetical protein LSH36_808g00028 [Paralvinella palmiformis]
MSRRQTTTLTLLSLYGVYLLLANVYEILTGQLAIVPQRSPTTTTESGSPEDAGRIRFDGKKRPMAVSESAGAYSAKSELTWHGSQSDGRPAGEYPERFPIPRSRSGTVSENSGRGLSHRQVLHVIDDVITPVADDYWPRIWPKPFAEEFDDRIIAQLAYLPSSHDTGRPMEIQHSYKTILVYNNQEPNLVSGGHVFADCPVSRCTISKNVAMATEADVILFQNGVPERIPEAKPANQIWILYLLEAPLHTQRLHDLNGLINWTATYRRDSTLVTPYEKFVLDGVPPPDVAGRGVGQRPLAKTKKIAWFVSNCYTSNGRLEYVHELERYIDVDVFGDCGRLRCPRGRDEEMCHEMLRNDYYFYLAFENSNCRDYITEKLFHNALA